MTGRVSIQLQTRTLARLDGELLIAGYFEGDRPLRGGVARIDWRLCGFVSDLLERGRLTGARGEATLTTSGGVLRAPRILLLGLGSRERFQTTAAQDAMRDAAARAIALGVRRIIVSPLGIASDDFVRHAPAVVGGLLEAVHDGAELLVSLAIAPAEADRAHAALLTATRALGSDAVEVRRPPRPAASGDRAPRGLPAAS